MTNRYILQLPTMRVAKPKLAIAAHFDRESILVNMSVVPAALCRVRDYAG
jgi:hypothetical protein